MTKELSKQLCELCGVESKWKCKKPKYGVCPEDCKNCLYWQDDEIDFGKPNNFVKLLELMHNLDYEIVNPFSSDIPLVAGHIKSIIMRLWDEDEDNEELKQAIKNTEWEY